MLTKKARAGAPPLPSQKLQQKKYDSVSSWGVRCLPSWGVCCLGVCPHSVCAAWVCALMACVLPGCVPSGVCLALYGLGARPAWHLSHALWLSARTSVLPISFSPPPGSASKSTAMGSLLLQPHTHTQFVTGTEQGGSCCRHIHTQVPGTNAPLVWLRRHVLGAPSVKPEIHQVDGSQHGSCDRCCQVMMT